MSAILHQQLMAAYGAASGGGSSDPNFSNVALLLHMEGANGSTTFTDNSPRPKDVTPFGNAQISTAQSQFGGASASFDGSGDYLQVATGTDFEFGTGDFTIEFWLRLNNASAQQNIYESRVSTEASRPVIGFNAGTLRYLNGGTIDRITSGTLVANTWYHVAVARFGTNTRMFVNGTQAGATFTDTTNYGVGAGRPLIGSFAGTAAFLNGFIDELRVTKGVARYTANFTPPTAPFPDA